MTPRKKPTDSAEDDNDLELEETPEEVIADLGFDPLEIEDTEGDDDLMADYKDWVLRIATKVGNNLGVSPIAALQKASGHSRPTGFDRTNRICGRWKGS
jgi:hypothetical protein